MNKDFIAKAFTEHLRDNLGNKLTDATATGLLNMLLQILSDPRAAEVAKEDSGPA